MDQVDENVKRIAELEAALAQQQAISEALVDLTRRQAFHISAETMLRLAQGHRPPSLTDAAEIIRSLWCSSSTTGCAVVPREATEAMAYAGAYALREEASMHSAWRAMVDAAEGGR